MEGITPFYDTDRGESEYYKKAKPSDKILMPLTRTGFEALLERALGHYDLPVDDSARQVLCGWVHHIDRECNTTTIKEVAAAMHKQCSNGLTSVIHSEISQKNRGRLVDANATPTANGAIDTNETVQ